MRSIHRFASVAALSLLASLFAPPALGQTTETCAGGDCFAVFVMPDTQNYTLRLPDGTIEDRRAALWQRFSRWICDNRSGWTDPDGNSMDIELVVHLGDIVQNNDSDGTNCPDNACEWELADAAFSELDLCRSGPVPYLVVAGNHDWDGSFADSDSETTSTDAYNTYFGEGVLSRTFWLSRCLTLELPMCTMPNLWYMGGGDADVNEADGGNRIPAESREAVPPCRQGAGNCSQTPAGPPADQPGRHRTGFVVSPGGSPFLFLGLEYTHGLFYSKQWPKSLMDANPQVPTLLFNHEGIQGGSATWQDFVPPHSQVFMTLNGHEGNEAYEQLNTVTLPPDGANYIVDRTYTVPRVVRNYQWRGAIGWNAIMVFDPGRGEVRMQSYRLDGNYDPADPAADDLGFTSFGIVSETDPELADPELINPLVVALPDTQPRSADVCPDLFNPGQEDADGDGFGDPCDICPNDADPDQADTDGSGLGDACNAGVDPDGDEFENSFDNCPDTANPDQADTDGSGLGDACNDAADPDGDEFEDSFDNCPDTFNPDQADADGSGIGNACNDDIDVDGDEFEDDNDNCVSEPNPIQADLDGDGVGNTCDVCPLVADPGQEDGDGDGVGDACEGAQEGDYDGDLVSDSIDNCKFVTNPNQCDADADGFGNVCDQDISNSPETGLVDEVDLALFELQRQAGATGPPCSLAADFDDSLTVDDVVNAGDVANMMGTVISQHFGKRMDEEVDGACPGGPTCRSGLACAVLPAIAGGCLDFDGDGVANDDDNCQFVPNANQCDSDVDGFGNVCDQDLVSDAAGLVDDADFAEFQQQFGSTGPPCSLSADFDDTLDDDIVNSNDASNMMGTGISQNYGERMDGDVDGACPGGETCRSGLPCAVLPAVAGGCP